MPVYQQSYRNYSGQFRHRFRWAIVLSQELQILVSSKIFLLLVLIAALHTLFRLLQIVAFDVVMQDPNNLLTPLLNQVTFLMVKRETFFEFLRLQTPLVFLTMLFAGAGMICNDFRNNLMEVYFSKPITWLDYLLGKIMSLIVVGLCMTALPATFLVVVHNALLPSWELLGQSWWWPIAIFAFSMVVVLSAALATLASSALIKSHGYAAIAIFMVVLANSTMSLVLAELLREMNYLIMSYPLAIHRLGQVFFREDRPLFNVAWHWSLLYFLLVVFVSVSIVVARVRRAEVA